MNSVLQKRIGRLLNALVASCLALFVAPASALQLSDATFADAVEVDSQRLVVNGAGIRSKLIFDVYAIALYLPEKVGSYDEIKAKSAPRRIAIMPLRNLTAQQFVDALAVGLRANHTDEELTRLRPAVVQFTDTLLAIQEVRKGTPVSLDYLPQSGTRVSIAGQQRGNDIPGDAFFLALLKVWLGDKPVQPDLKKQLLGQ